MVKFSVYLNRLVFVMFSFSKINLNNRLFKTYHQYLASNLNIKNLKLNESIALVCITSERHSIKPFSL